MHIGSLKPTADVRYCRAGTKIPFEPELTENTLVWRWDRIFNTAVDIRYTFAESCYVGAVVPGIEGAAKIEVLVDGEPVACGKENALLTVNKCGSELTLRVHGELLDVVLSETEIFGITDNDGIPAILPRPHVSKRLGESIGISTIIGEGEDAAFAKDFLTDSLSERHLALCKEGVSLTFELSSGYEAERYTVDVTSSAASVKAGSRIALLWGACRVIELWNDAKLPLLKIDDKPDMPMRGFHMGLPRKDRIGFVKKLFRYVLLPLGYNHVILEFNAAMRFDRHPEISEAWLESEKLFREGKRPRVTHSNMGADGTLLEKEDVREIIDTLESYGIEIVPEVQSLSHVQYLTNAYPEISEYVQTQEDSSDSRSVDVVKVDPAAHCYCPSRKDTMQYIFDIIDEILEVARPKRYVHIGHDEAYHVGYCPVCAKRGGPGIFVDHVKALHSYLAEKGLKVMMWSDMLHTTMYYTGEAFKDVKSELPKDILMLDFTWYFEFDRDIEDDITGEGFSIMMGNLYSSHYPRYAKRIAKPDMVGGEISTWVTVREEDFAESGKFLDLVVTAEMLWNAYSYRESDNQAYRHIAGHNMLPKMRDLMHGKYELYLKGGEAEAVGYLPGNTDNLPKDLVSLGASVPTDSLAVDKNYDRLIFKHATLYRAPRIGWNPLYEVGRYTVTYSDGERVDIPVKYAGGILAWNSVYGEPLPKQYYRHQGYIGSWFADPVYEGHSAHGEPILILGQPWDNPYPEKTIAKISYTPTEGDYAVLVSAGVLGVKE